MDRSKTEILQALSSNRRHLMILAMGSGALLAAGVLEVADGNNLSGEGLILGAFATAIGVGLLRRQAENLEDQLVASKEIALQLETGISE